MHHDVERGVELLNRAEMLEPGNPLLPVALWKGNLLAGRYDAALRNLLSADILTDLAPELQALYASGGWPAVNAKVLEYRNRYDWPCGSRGLGAHWRAQIGDIDGALTCLEEWQSAGRLGPWLYLAASPAWDPLRNEPRFQALLEKMNLTQYARKL